MGFLDVEFPIIFSFTVFQIRYMGYPFLPVENSTPKLASDPGVSDEYYHSGWPYNLTYSRSFVHRYGFSPLILLFRLVA